LQSILRTVGITDSNFELLMADDGDFNHFAYRDKGNHKVVIYTVRLHGTMTRCPLCDMSGNLTKQGHNIQR